MTRVNDYLRPRGQQRHNHAPQVEFDEPTHTYTLNGRKVPSVTQIIRSLIPCFEADQWYLDRGTAVHACAALIAWGKEFTNDPQIDGQVKAIRAWFRDVKPAVIGAEHIICHATLRYAGRYDLFCGIGGNNVLVDYKGSPCPDVTRIQLGGYALAMDPGGPVIGYEVQPRDDGSYKMGEKLDLKAGRREFAALLGAWNIREKMGVNG